MSRLVVATLVSALAVVPAFAQGVTAPAGAVDPGALGGTQIAGLCLLSQQAVFANAKVGVAASQRLKELTAQSQSEIEAESAVLQKDARALDGQRTSLKPADLTEKQAALAARLKALQDKADLRNREIQATREKAQARIVQELRPVVAQVYGAHRCGLLIDRNTVFGGNMGGDLTAAVVQGLDAKIATISFDRESLAATGAPAKQATR
jgi:Skp family chaperone for outer membrane proteins